MCVMVCIWRSDKNRRESILFSYVGPKDPTQVIRLGGKYLYPLSHVVNPSLTLFFLPYSLPLSSPFLLSFYFCISVVDFLLICLRV